MQFTANLAVKGTRYYKAAEMLQKGSLSSGLPIRLEHQPDNPHDKNAVAVWVKRTGAMLGHISKELAPKYAALINSGKIVEASIANITKEGAYINIDVRIVYEQSDDQLAEKHSSRLWQSSSSMPAEAGVYAIRNIESGRQYIGSSNNVRDRIRSHINELSQGCHANHALQGDFSSLGLNYFEAKVLTSGVSLSNLATEEASRISSHLNAGSALYNLTIDGQGLGRTHGHSDSKPVSDRLAWQREDIERRRVDEIFTEQRKQIYETFEPGLAALLPASDTKSDSSNHRQPEPAIPELIAKPQDYMWLWSLALIVGVFVYFYNKTTERAAPPPPVVQATQRANVAPKPQSPPSEGEVISKGTTTLRSGPDDKDMRHCLNLTTDAEIMRCTTQVR